MHRRLLIIVLASLPLAGCEQMKSKEQRTRLGQALSAYVGAIRWGNFDTARAFAVPRSGPAPQFDTEALAGLKVTGFSTRIHRVNETADEANVTTSFTYYHLDSASIRQVEQNVVWYFDGSQGSWLMDGPLPDFSR